MIFRPLSAGGSGLELVGIKEPNLPSFSLDVWSSENYHENCQNYGEKDENVGVKFSEWSISDISNIFMDFFFQHVGKKTEEACQKYEE